VRIAVVPRANRRCFEARKGAYEHVREFMFGVNRSSLLNIILHESRRPAQFADPHKLSKAYDKSCYSIRIPPTACHKAGPFARRAAKETICLAHRPTSTRTAY
jgi:hypothetical protein